MADSAPIPPPKDDDAEDVFWALSTATTLYQRGDRAEAVRWLRRAAEQASDQNADGRALELMKAAAELSAKLGAPPSPSVAPPAARPSVPPPLPKRAAPPAPSAPSGPPPLPSAPRVGPAPPSVPAPSSIPATRPSSPGTRVPAPAPSKPASRAGGRERHGTLTGRRGASARRGSSTDLDRVPRPPGVPAEIPDTPVDDLDEDTNVYEGKPRSSKARKPAPPEIATKPSMPVPISPIKPAPIAAPAKPQTTSSPPVGRPIAAPITPLSKPLVAKVDPAPEKTEPSAKAVSVKPEPPAKVAALRAEPAKPSPVKVEPAVKSEAPPAKPPVEEPKKVTITEPAPRPVMLRKGTMQLVDEGFESMLDTPEPPPSAVPIFVELPLPPASARGEPAESAAPQKAVERSVPEVPVSMGPQVAPNPGALGAPVAAAPAVTATRGLLAQRVALIADPSGGARVVRFDDAASLPEGAIAVIVVPLSSEDGEPLARLLGQTKP